MVGVIGCMSFTVPWWCGTRLLGSVRDSRLGTLDYGPGGPCSMLDGLLLATKHLIPWDIGCPGWHGYDYDACTQSIYHEGLTNFCLDDGKNLVRHNSDSPFDVASIGGWPEAESYYRRKWITSDGTMGPWRTNG